MSTGVVVVTVTASDESQALALVEAVVGEGLAACGQVSGPIRSVYRWKGAVERSQEWVATFRTTEVTSARVVAHLRAAHSYEVPEIVVTPVVGGDPDYLGWVVDESS